MPNLCGRRLGKYELLERIAFGGMAEVYRAFQPGVERQVVVKILHDPSCRFTRLCGAFNGGPCHSGACTIHTSSASSTWTSTRSSIIW